MTDFLGTAFFLFFFKSLYSFSGSTSFSYLLCCYDFMRILNINININIVHTIK